MNLSPPNCLYTSKLALTIVYRETSKHSGLKIVDDNNYIYEFDRKYSDKPYWKCEIRV